MLITIEEYIRYYIKAYGGSPSLTDFNFEDAYLLTEEENNKHISDMCNRSRQIASEDAEIIISRVEELNNLLDEFVPIFNKFFTVGQSYYDYFWTHVVPIININDKKVKLSDYVYNIHNMIKPYISHMRPKLSIEYNNSDISKFLKRKGIRNPYTYYRWVTTGKNPADDTIAGNNRTKTIYNKLKTNYPSIEIYRERSIFAVDEDGNSSYHRPDIFYVYNNVLYLIECKKDIGCCDLTQLNNYKILLEMIFNPKKTVAVFDVLEKKG